MLAECEIKNPVRLKSFVAAIAAFENAWKQ